MLLATSRAGDRRLRDAMGVGIATALGVNPLIELLSGSITMTGGHGTGAALG